MSREGWMTVQVIAVLVGVVAAMFAPAVNFATTMWLIAILIVGYAGGRVDGNTR